MSFTQLKMLLNALKLHLNLLNFQNQKIKKKTNSSWGGYPLELFEGGRIPHPPLAETMGGAHSMHPSTSAWSVNQTLVLARKGAFKVSEMFSKHPLTQAVV
jgi:hypothetical protein